MLCWPFDGIKKKKQVLLVTPCPFNNKIGPLGFARSELTVLLRTSSKMPITFRLAAIQCVTAHTATHPKLTTDYHITDPLQEKLVVDMLSLILPGVMGALQDVATCKDNPGHALIVVRYFFT